MRYGIACLISLLVAGCEREVAMTDDRVPKWTLVEDQRIGSVDDEAKGFTHIDDLLVARDRVVYAISRRDGRTQVIDTTGAFLRTFGRLGGGPGEFQRIDRVGFLGDTVWMVDEQSDRLTKFDRSGSVLATYASAYRPRFPGALLANGTSLLTRPLRDATGDTALILLLSHQHPGKSPVNASLDSGRVGTRPAGNGKAAQVPIAADTDTVVVLSRRNATAFVPIMLPYNTRPVTALFSQPLSDAPFWKGSIDGRALVIVHRPAAQTADVAYYEVVKLTAGLDTVFTRRYAYRPMPAPGALIDSIVSNTEEGKLGMKREVVFAPAHRPPVTDALLGNDGTVWLRREFSYGPDARWTVLDGEGRLAGEVSIPQSHTVRAADDRYVWTTITDETDVPFIVRYRIVKAGGS
jgi:hypothetical protein